MSDENNVENELIDDLDSLQKDIEKTPSIGILHEND